MSAFDAKRVSREYTQTNDAPPEKVFPLLCPVREADWVPGWQYRLIYSESGVAEDGCVFSTPNDSGTETVWMVTHYDPAAFTIAFAWVEPGIDRDAAPDRAEPCSRWQDERTHSLFLHRTFSGGQCRP